MIFVHERLSITILLFSLALGVWGFWNYLRGEGVTGSYMGALVIAIGLIVLEVVLGVILYLQGLRPPRSGMHILYGVVSLITLPAAFTFTRGRTSRYESLIYAVIALFLVGVVIRLRTTGGM